MTTALEHSDHIFASKPGTWLMVCDHVVGTSSKDGKIRYMPGAKLRVTCAYGVLWCLDENARTVTFEREDTVCLERRQ